MDHLQCVKCKSSISNELREKLICGCFICSKCIHHLESINVKRVFCPFCNAHHNIGKYIKELFYAKSNTVVLEQEDPFLNLEIGAHETNQSNLCHWGFEYGLEVLASGYQSSNNPKK
jgi:hypothetical protein